MKIDELKWEYQPIENPDWDFARNLFTVLKRPQGTLSQSVFSVRHESLIAPNRDYPYQGLTVLVGKEYWKFLDCIFFGIKNVKLDPKNVLVFPWKCIYNYTSKNIDVGVEYYLAKTKGEGLSARILFDIKNTDYNEYELIVRPLVDIRNVFHNSVSEEIHNNIINDSLIARRNNNFISFKIFGGNILSNKEVLSWRYKLGSGNRTYAQDGVRFISEWRAPVFVGELTKNFSGDCKIMLDINCNKNASVDFQQNEHEEKIYLERIADKFNCKKEILARIIASDKFGIFEGDLLIPEAGDFWFKQIWLRDLFEFLINNFKTVMKIDEKRIEGIINQCLKYQDVVTGLFPNFLGNYNSTDSTLLFFILAEKYIRQTKDYELAKRVLPRLNIFIEKFSKNKREVNGPPVIRNNLLLSTPWHSWTDSRINLMNELIATRIPLEWINEKNLKEFCKPVLLPEINALFIRALKAGELIAKFVNCTEEQMFRDLYNSAVLEYKEVFKNNDFLYSLAWDGNKDPTETSMTLVSAVLLYDHVFSRNDLEKMWPFVEKLIVKRKGKTFGVLVKNTKDRIFFNEAQYHGSVMWPRDVPYLIKYLEIIGKKEMIEEILQNHLEHQMNEGAIFYSQELFSLPDGNNPSPTETRDNPVPVKNPVQLWSQFCDEYL